MKKNIFVLLITFMSSTVAYSDVMMLEPCKAEFSLKRNTALNTLFLRRR